jgi:AcrR family transcriptional regulator
MSTDTQHRSVGRPLDASIDGRILTAGLELYAERGWYGLTMHRISQRAGVGKAALYTRWSSTVDLLRQACDQYLVYEIVTDLPIREFLLVEARWQAQLKMGSFAMAASRLMLESSFGPPELEEIQHRVIGSRVATLRARIEEAVATGELPADVSAIRLLDLLEGAMAMHVAITPDQLRERMLELLPEYILATVDSLLFLAEHGMLAAPGVQHSPGPAAP